MSKCAGCTFEWDKTMEEREYLGYALVNGLTERVYKTMTLCVFCVRLWDNIPNRLDGDPV